MNCSDNVSSDAVLPEENILYSRRAGMGYAHANQLKQVNKWNGDDLIIIYDPESSFRNMFPDAVIIPSLYERAGRQK